jgi:hypothetical protein
MTMGTGGEPADRGSIDELLDNLMEIDPDALREAEFEQTQSILDTLAGKTISRAVLEDRRIVIETNDGYRYFFFGFMGKGA